MRKIFVILLFCSCAPDKWEGSLQENALVRFCLESSCMKEQLGILLDSAEISIQMAIYSFEDREIAQKLVQAQKRKVTVQVVSDYESESQSAFQYLLSKNVPVILGNDYGIMHHKYFVIDSRYVVTGSANLSEGMGKQYNHMLVFNSKAMAAIYQEDFAWMYKKRAFGSDKKPELVPLWKQEPICDNFRCYEIFFTPYLNYYPPYQFTDPNNSNNMLVYSNALGVINHELFKAKYSVDIISFSLSDLVLLDYLKKSNLKVRVWLDKSQFVSRNKEIRQGILALAASKQVKLFNKLDYLLHHKVIIIDNEKIILGSYNFSHAGANDNDENFMLINPAQTIISLFQGEIRKIEQDSYYLLP
jgi:phosphatidylserine/phosphatidylglycerophosphate/cardiolipin synthase-like enzyme